MSDCKITLGVQTLPENEVIEVLGELEDNYEQKISFSAFSFRC